MEHYSEDTGGDSTTDKPRHSILLNVISHSCEFEENCDKTGEPSKIENVLKKHVTFKKSKSLTQSIESSKAVLKDGRYFGVILSFFAAVQYSLNLLSIKLLEYHPCNLAVYRFAIIAVITFLYVIYYGYFFKRKTIESEAELELASSKLKVWPCKKTTGVIFLYAVLSVNATLFLLYGLTYIDIFNATVIISSAPVFITLAAWLYLGEKFGLVPVVTVACALLATGILCQIPVFTGDSKWNINLITGTIYCFTSMLLVTFHQVIFARHLKSVHNTVIQFSVAVYGIVQTCIVAYTFSLLSSPKSLSEIGLIIASALLEGGAQIFVIYAVKYQQLEIILLIKTVTEVVAAYIWQTLFLQQGLYSICSIIGAFLMLACVSLAILRSIVMHLPENNAAKQYFPCLLR